MKDHTYTGKNKDTETKIEIPTPPLVSRVLVTIPAPRVLFCQTPHNSTEAKTETENR